MLTYVFIIALVGKEERNKDFSEALTEDQNGHAVGPDDVKAIQAEQGQEKERSS